MKQNKIRIGAAAFAALFLFTGFMLWRLFSDGRQSAAVFDAVAGLLQEQSAAEDGTGNGGAVNGTAVQESPGQEAFERYGAVYAQNNDFVGWIFISGTNINYPVMQTKDNPDYYLKHSFEKQYSSYGVPYVQENCHLDLSDNCVLYGHHMKDGSMFSELCNYADEEFYRAHTVIRFDTLSGFGEYEIVAVFKTVACSEQGFKYYHFVDAHCSDEFDAYIAQCKELALYDTGITAEYGDRLLTLSTCEYSRKNGRMVIVAKRITQ